MRLSLVPDHLSQLGRFCTTATVTFTTSLIVLMALTEWLRINYRISYVVAFLASNATGYFLNGRWTFPESRGKTDRLTIFRFMIVNLVMLTLNSVILRLLVEKAHLWYVTATVLLAIITTPVGFFAHRTVSFGVGQAPERD
jgi:putative flippase GtrA